ncbi:MAG: hypothetical protein H7A46_10960 [Verrucomicrobiales bacterium]|nr:hypothetical protein [Verrucomicrobiales bacterium]
MTAFPVVARELRVSSRRPGTFGTRVGAALLALLLSVMVYLATERSTPAVRGTSIFYALAWLSWLYCLLAGARLTSDCISVERREGTLGLLFLTDLKGFDIVLGKLAATSMHSIYGLLAILPVLGLPMLLGGVALGQLLQVVAVLTVTLFFSLAVGMFVSCWFENSRRALGGTLILLVLITGGPWLLLALQLADHRGGRPDFLLATPSPLLAQALAATEPGRGKPDHLLWPSVSWVAGFALLFFVLACVALPRFWRELPRLLPSRSGAGRDGGAAPIRSVATAGYRTRLLNLNPFHWLTCRKPSRLRIEVGVLVLLTLLWFWGTSEWQAGHDVGWFILTSIGLHVIFKVRVSLAAASQLAEERRTGSMELLLSTPLTVGRIFSGQLRSLWRWGGLWLGFILVVDVVLLLQAVDQVFSERNVMISAAFWHMASLPLDALAIAVLAMWRALVAPHATQASGSAFFRVIVLPCLAWIVGTIFVGILHLDRGWVGRLDETAIVLLFYVGCLANALFWGLFAWGRLKRRFREVAAERYQRKRGWFRTWFGGH